MHRRSRHFVGEAYQPGDAAAEAGAVDRAANLLSREGTHVRHVCSLLAFEDEICLHLFETDSAEVVAEVGRRAELSFDRIWPAVRFSSEPPGIVSGEA